MATWAEFARGTAEVLRAERRGERDAWEPFEGGASALAEAGEQLLVQPPAGIALLATVSAGGVPRVHPFMPRVLEGRLCAFIVGTSPKLRDLLAGRQCVVHAAPAPQDEEFWIRGRAVRIADPARIGAALGAMPWGKPALEILMEFDLEQAGWTRWLDFGTSMHRPQHHRWRAEIVRTW